VSPLVPEEGQPTVGTSGPPAWAGTPPEAERPAGAERAARHRQPPPRVRSRRGRRKARKQHGSFLRELPVLLVIAILLALLIKTFLVQAFYIPSGSMENTLQIRDRVLVNKLVYRFRDVHRGEVVVFSGVDSWNPETVVSPPGNIVQRVLRDIGSALGFAPAGQEDFIKRVIGVPGDHVACCDTEGRVTVNGVALTEPYVFQDDHRAFSTVVPKGRLWVMGDHRSLSADSRFHTFDPGGGAIPENKVVGRAFVIIWPPSRVGTLPVPKTFAQHFPQPATVTGMAATGAPYALGLSAALPVVALRRRPRTGRTLIHSRGDRRG
jgi:signal peptidase I